MKSVSNESGNPYAPPTAEVRDNTNVIPELAGLGERFAAWILDTLIVGVLLVVPLVAGMDRQALQEAALQNDSEAVVAAMFSTGSTLGLLLGSAIWLGLTTYFVARNSQTIGKKIVGIKVARTDGSRASLGRIFWLRNVVNALPGSIPVIGNLYVIIDPLFIFHGSRKCLHDRIADTIVIKA